MVEKISLSLLPDNTTISEDGMIVFAGVRADDLAKEYGTPLFVYDEEHIRQRCREAVNAFPDVVSYAAKAFLSKAMASLAYEEGMGLDAGLEAVVDRLNLGKYSKQYAPYDSTVTSLLK